MLRLCAMAFIVSLLMSTTSFAPTMAQTQAGPGQGTACNFLTSLMNSSIGFLLAETRGSQKYNIASDNVLAYNALITVCKGVYAGWGGAVNSSITRCCGRGYDNMHEATFGTPIRLPIQATNTYNVTDRFPTGPWKVYFENHNGTGFLSDAQYGDVAAYSALELEREGNHAAALHEITLLNWMYDGHGIRDDVFRFSTKPDEYGIYQTFKSALYILALAKTGQTIPSGLISTVESMQGGDGGFHTGYNATGNYSMTQENVETTSIAMFSIHSTPGWIPIETLPFSYANLTITLPDKGLVQVHPNFENRDVWGHNFTTTAVFDNKTLIANQTQFLDPGGYADTPQWRLNVTLDPYSPHTITITYGNATEIHRFAALAPALAGPGNTTLWYLVIISLGALLLATILLFHRRRSRRRDGNKSTLE